MDGFRMSNNTTAPALAGDSLDKQLSMSPSAIRSRQLRAKRAAARKLPKKELAIPVEQRDERDFKIAKMLAEQELFNEQLEKRREAERTVPSMSAGLDENLIYTGKIEVIESVIARRGTGRVQPQGTGSSGKVKRFRVKLGGDKEAEAVLRALVGTFKDDRLDSEVIEAVPDSDIFRCRVCGHTERFWRSICFHFENTVDSELTAYNSSPDAVLQDHARAFLDERAAQRRHKREFNKAARAAKAEARSGQLIEK
jgi:hypothetical protein